MPGEPGGRAQAPAIDAHRLTAGYGVVAVLRDLTLQVPAGATVALLGGNGTGKSTLLQVLAGLRAPRGGRLCVLGHDLPGERWALRGQVGLVGHDSLLYRDLTITENLRYHAALHRLPASRADEVIALTELTARADQQVGVLSRGLVQRAAVARALLAEPSLLLLDEPLANLDPAVATLLAELLGPRPDRTRVISSHDPERALAEADLALVLGRGAAPLYAGEAGALSVAEVEAMYA